MMIEKVKQVEQVLSSIEVPGFDVDVVSSGVVTGFRISHDGKRIVVFVSFRSSQPGCLFCKFLNNTLWDAIISRIKDRLRQVGFEEVYVVDETMRNSFSPPQG